MLIELDKQDMQNLNVFLSRVDLKGAEVPAFMKVVEAINKATEKEESVGE